MPEIGMLDLITPMQAGAQIVAQANNIRRQREEMALRQIESQQRAEELRQLGRAREVQAKTAEDALNTEKERRAARLLFGEAYSKAYTDFVNTKPDSTESERAEFALRSALPKAHPDDVPDIIKSISASAMGQDKNKVAMERAMAAIQNQMQLNEIRMQRAEDYAKHLEAQIDMSRRSLEEREIFHQAANAAKQKAEEARKENQDLNRRLKYIQEITSAGQRAFDGAIKAGGPMALQDAQNSKTRAERMVQERWMTEMGSIPGMQPSPKTVTPPDTDEDEGNVDTEGNAIGSDSMIPKVTAPVVKPAPKKKANSVLKEFNFDPTKGLVPVQ